MGSLSSWCICSSPSEGVSTHDEIVTTTGINKWFLKDQEHDGAAVVREEQENGRMEGLEFVQIGNGDSFLLV